MLSLSKKNDDNFTFDFEYIMSIINCDFFANKISYYIINRIAQLIRVCNIKNVIMFLLEYTFLKIFLLEK